ncbi:hypothetical protein GLI01_35090 [Gluconacetobacter liquefaciens]|uniref:Uncharacterized protein n=1 Tax=Gluconacetobacter liquefaciens TaxID=89584 RepID=A0A370G2I7_GLULI|nr:hypothetical protein [Gluconacetobacter liquefaciens]RDI36273.1 hypothetical protein C7453_11157 [Gluconacetobacter liquefaciens]GBR11479.1 hypothetical protein AA0522_2477 [Gluconacetobacter liquefaciens NRIC 0522]GEB39474.1 hypothetical protein GLI01_35090 [Gluconacetobacter liquefaciens]
MKTILLGLAGALALAAYGAGPARAQVVGPVGHGEIPACPDAGGNHLNYVPASGRFACGTTGAPWVGAMVTLSADAAMAATGGNLVQMNVWNSKVFDTSSFWSAAAPGQFTIPAGVSRVRVSLSISQSGIGANQFLVHRNGAGVVGSFRISVPAGYSDDGANGVSGVIPVSPGDAISIAYASVAAFTLTADTTTWLQIEAVP